MKEENPNVGGSNKSKGQNLQKSTSSWKEIFETPTNGLKEKVFCLRKKRHAAEFAKNWDAISKLIAVNYKQKGSEMTMAIKNMENYVINIPKYSEDMASSVDVFAWKIKYNETKRN